MISCIVPVYNGERYLAETLESILRQTASDLEVLVCDDGSTDRTPEVIAGFGARVRGLRQDNAGVAAARNLGIAAARGEWIAFLDADDLWEKTSLEEHLENFRAHPELSVSVAMTENFWMPGLEEEQRRLAGTARARPLLAYVCGAMLVRRSVFEEVGPFDTAVPHTSEIDWVTRLKQAGKRIGPLERVLHRRRMHPGSFSRQKSKKSLDNYLNFLKRHIDRQRQT